MLAYFKVVGPGLVYLHPFEGAVDPGFGVPGGPVDPGFGIGVLPHPGQGLPVGPNRPDNSLPGNPHFPNNSLPSGPPPHINPGATLVLVRDSAGVWHYAAIQPGQPVPPPIAGMPLPGGPPNTATNPIAPGAAPKRP